MKTLNPAHLHHAYIAEGYSGEPIRAWITTNIPDGEIIFQKHDVFSIDDARALTVSDIQAGGRQFFIIQTGSMTREAMHALLKLCEEPNPATTFFFIMPQIDILPTFRSRLQVIYIEEKHEISSDAVSFVSATAPERLKIAEKYLVELKDENPQAKQKLLHFISDIEQTLYKTISKEGTAAALKQCLNAKQLLRESGNPPKQILEMLSLSFS